MLPGPSHLDHQWQSPSRYHPSTIIGTTVATNLAKGTGTSYKATFTNSYNLAPKVGLAVCRLETSPIS